MEDLRIIYVSDGSMVAESIAERFRSDRYNLHVELFPLNRSFKMTSAGSSTSLSSLASSPPTLHSRTSSSVSIPNSKNNTGRLFQHGSNSSLTSLSHSPSMSLVKSSASPKMSSSLPESHRHFVQKTGRSSSMTETILEADTFDHKGWSTWEHENDMSGKMPVLVVTPGMLKHLETISGESRTVLLNLLADNLLPAVLECFVASDEVKAKLTKVFPNYSHFWGHLQVGESRESFQRCVIGLLTMLEMRRDTMPLPSLKKCSVLPERHVMAGDTVYLLLESRLTEDTDISALEVRFHDLNHGTARRISDLLYELQVPDCNTTSISADIFTISGEYLDRVIVYYKDKREALVSLLCEVEDPTKFLCELYPQNIVSREEIDVALTDLFRGKRDDMRGEPKSLMEFAQNYELDRLLQSLKESASNLVKLNNTPNDRGDTDMACYLSPEYEGIVASNPSGYDESDCESLEDNYVTPDDIVPCSDLYLPVLPAVVSQHKRKTSSTSCPEMGCTKITNDCRRCSAPSQEQDVNTIVFHQYSSLTESTQHLFGVSSTGTLPPNTPCAINECERMPQPWSTKGSTEGPSRGESISLKALVLKNEAGKVSSCRCKEANDPDDKENFTISPEQGKYFEEQGVYETPLSTKDTAWSERGRRAEEMKKQMLSSSTTRPPPLPPRRKSSLENNLHSQTKPVSEECPTPPKPHTLKTLNFFRKNVHKSKGTCKEKDPINNESTSVKVLSDSRTTSNFSKVSSLLHSVEENTKSEFIALSDISPKANKKTSFRNGHLTTSQNVLSVEDTYLSTTQTQNLASHNDASPVIKRHNRSKPTSEISRLKRAGWVSPPMTENNDDALIFENDADQDYLFPLPPSSGFGDPKSD